MFYIRQRLRRGKYGYCVPCSNSFDDLAQHKWDIHPARFAKTLRGEYDNEVCGRIFVHRFCGRMVRVSRDWDHNNPQAEEPPSHPECEKAVFDKNIRGLVVESTGVPVDSLPVVESDEFEDLWEEDI